MNRFQTLLAELPLIAILRGLHADQAVEVGTVLLDAGFRVIEVPLNSPDPFTTIGLLAERFGDQAMIGAGTVMTPGQVHELAKRGGELVVMPHSDPAVIDAAKTLSLTCAPGVATPTEAFSALAAGADALKLFPAEALPPEVVKAWRAVVPNEIGLFPVGGIRPDSMARYLTAGASGFGLGSALFKPGLTVEHLEDNARAFAKAYAAWQNES